MCSREGGSLLCAQGLWCRELLLVGVCVHGGAPESKPFLAHIGVCNGVRLCVCIVCVREQSSPIFTGESCTLCVHSTSDLCCSSPWGRVPRAWHEAPGDWASCLVPAVLYQVVLCRAQHVALGPARSSTQTPHLCDLSSAPGNCCGAWREGRH